MQIGAVGFSPYPNYVYNTNAISSASMNKISALSDDVLDHKIGFEESSSYDMSLNVNPLKQGESQDFASILDSQLVEGRMRQYMFFGEEQ